MSNPKPYYWLSDYEREKKLWEEEKRKIRILGIDKDRQLVRFLDGFGKEYVMGYTDYGYGSRYFWFMDKKQYF